MAHGESSVSVSLSDWIVAVKLLVVVVGVAGVMEVVGCGCALVVIGVVVGVVVGVGGVVVLIGLVIVLVSVVLAVAVALVSGLSLVNALLLLAINFATWFLRCDSGDCTHSLFVLLHVAVILAVSLLWVLLTYLNRSESMQIGVSVLF